MPNRKQAGFARLLLMLTVALAVAAAAYWYFAIYKGQSNGQEAPQSLGAKLYEQAQNPVKDKLPSTNPFEGAKVNPFE